jgi:hypothetical protein
MARKSRKPSGTKAESLLNESTFFVDRCLGKYVGMSLQSAGLRFEFHADHFTDDADDETWISAVGRRGWVVLTKDKAISKRPAELHAIETANVRMFSLSRGNLTGEQMVRLFVDNRLRIGRFIKNHPPPFIARVSASGVVLARACWDQSAPQDTATSPKCHSHIPEVWAPALDIRQCRPTGH